jgi:hypothetical protein
MKYKNTWKSELFNDKKHNSCGNKLRTYRLFKEALATILNASKASATRPVQIGLER